MMTFSLRRLAGLTSLFENLCCVHICAMSTSGALVSRIGAPSVKKAAASLRLAEVVVCSSMGVLMFLVSLLAQMMPKRMASGGIRKPMTTIAATACDTSFAFLRADGVPVRPSVCEALQMPCMRCMPRATIART